MKSFFLGALLSTLVIACVDRAPDPQSNSPQSSTEQAVLLPTAYWYCETAGPGNCIVTEFHLGETSAPCIAACIAAGFPSPRCRLAHVQNWPCATDP